MKWVPISFCQLCIEQRSCKAGQLYTYWKYNSDSLLNYKEAVKKAQKFFTVSRRSICRWLTKAIEFDWIVRHQDTLFIRGWQQLFDKYQFRKKACYRFVLNDLCHFKTYCFAAVITYMAERTQGKKLERLRGYPGRSEKASAWVPMATSAIAKTLDVSRKTAIKYKKEASTNGYIKFRSSLKPIEINVSDLKRIRKSHPKRSKKLVISNGKVYVQLPDKVHCNSKSIKSVRRLHTAPP